MKKVELIKDILIIEEVEFPCKELISEAEKLSAWEQARVSSGKGKVESKIRSNTTLDISKTQELKELDQKLFEVFHQGIRKYIEHLPYVQVTNDEGYHLLRYEKGQFYKTHIDHFPEHPRQVSGLFYLNGDFKGGEIFFPRQELTIKPEPGKLVLFPSFFTHPHTSLDVEEGTKYAVVTWFENKPK